MKTVTTGSLAAMVLATAVALSFAAQAGDNKAPMPQTKGMQGMDPKLHEQTAEKPYKDCKPNPEKSAQQAKHPMPETKGMKGMDPKMHEMDCTEPEVAKQDPSKPAKHVHKAPGGG